MRAGTPGPPVRRFSRADGLWPFLLVRRFPRRHRSDPAPSDPEPGTDRHTARRAIRILSAFGPLT